MYLYILIFLVIILLIGLFLVLLINQNRSSTFEEGNGINIENNTISVNAEPSQFTFVNKQLTLLNAGGERKIIMEEKTLAPIDKFLHIKDTEETIISLEPNSISNISTIITGVTRELEVSSRIRTVVLTNDQDGFTRIISSSTNILSQDVPGLDFSQANIVLDESGFRIRVQGSSTKAVQWWAEITISTFKKT